MRALQYYTSLFPLSISLYHQKKHLNIGWYFISVDLFLKTIQFLFFNKLLNNINKLSTEYSCLSLLTTSMSETMIVYIFYSLSWVICKNCLSQVVQHLLVQAWHWPILSWQPPRVPAAQLQRCDSDLGNIFVLSASPATNNTVLTYVAK